MKVGVAPNVGIAVLTEVTTLVATVVVLAVTPIQHMPMLPTFEFDTMSEDISHRTSPSISSVNREGPPTTNDGDKADKESSQWNSEQAFFAVVGGFAIEND
jgi:hypothetical protein